jgi:hypothetical protein
MVPFSSLWVASRARKILELTMPRKIITSYWAKPIPNRAFDWSASYDGFEEGPYGYGETEQQAIADLTDNYDNPDQE